MRITSSRSAQRRGHTLVAGVLAAGLAVGVAGKPAWARGRAVEPVTDQQVLESIKKGVNYLLSTKKGDNWESGQYGEKYSHPNYGGETALVLYALLHVGQGLQDDPDIGPVLTYRSKELDPVVRWLSKNDPEGTYTAGLQASALALVRKDTEQGREAQKGLLLAKRFLVSTMGQDGGYTYGPPSVENPYAKDRKGDEDTKKRLDLSDVWAAYVDARIAGKGVDEAKKRLDDVVKQAGGYAGGVRGHLELLAEEINQRATDARLKKDSAAVKRCEDELAELNRISGSLLKTKGSAQEELEKARARVEDAAKKVRTGETKEVTETDKNGKETKKKVTTPRQELEADLAAAQKALAALENNVRTRFEPIGDISNGQYGTLGAWALNDVNIELPMAYWQISDRFWRLTQRRDGSWPYSDGKWPHGFGGDWVRPAMGVAGIASLYITAEMTDDKIRLEPKPDREIELGLEWLKANFKPDSDLYYMYGVERVGLASGLKYFGESTNWYTQGAASIISRQLGGGSWNDKFPGDPNQTICTAYAILFLARGRNPVAFNKLQYDGPWNARPRDDANITGWLSRKFERPINWQVVNMKVSAEEWADAPILLITGSKALKFEKADVEKIRAFINAGGLVFSTADGGKAEFTDSVKRLAGDVVEKKYEWRELKKDHVLFSSDFWPIANPPKLIGMSNGIREVWVHSSVDMGESWQGRRVSLKENFDFPANLLRYATGKMPMRTKLQALTVPEAGGSVVRNVDVARVDYGGNNDPEPGAWTRFAKLMKQDASTGVHTKSVKLRELDAKATPIAHMTGTTQFPSNPADVAAMQKYLNEGGMLFADSAGGSADFSKSFLQFMSQVYPKATLEAIPSTHPICSGSMTDGVSLTGGRGSIYRTYYRYKVGAPKGPQLQGIKVDGRYAVVFSAEDVTSGLLGTNTWGVLGYTPEAAQNVARNLILYGMDPKGSGNGDTPARSTKKSSEESLGD